MAPHQEQHHSARDLRFSVLVLLFLFAPAIKFAFAREKGSVDLLENRRAADFPATPRSAIDWAAWPHAFEAWHNDHFGLREKFVRAHNELMIFCLHTSPSPRIVVGREHWIFTSGVDLDLWRGADPFTESELEAWRRSLESRKRELDQRNVAYYFVIVPGKAEVYPEFLPERYRKGGPSRTEQLASYLAKTSRFEVLDLRAALLEEKAQDSADDFTYFPLGIHWNERGAAAGSRAITLKLAQLHPELQSVDDTIEGLPLIDEPGDSWAMRLYMPDLLTQQVRGVQFRERAKHVLTFTSLEDKREMIVDQEDKSLPRALVFHDSFGTTLPPILGRHFSHAAFVWKPEIDLALVESEHPDVVIQILNQRALATLQPQELNVEDDMRVRNGYKASREVALKLDVASNAPRIDCYLGGQVSLRDSASNARVVCTTENAADAFLLPEFQVRAGTHAILRLEFESSVASSSSILYQTKSNPTYTRRQQLHYQTHIGLNELEVEIIDPEFTGRLLFRPAQEIGTFLISALEVRLLAN